MLDDSKLKSYNGFKNLINHIESGVNTMATFKERVQKQSANRKLQEKEAKEKRDKKYAGVYFEDKKGTWGFRLTRTDSTGKSRDTNRGGFKTALQAKKAREDQAYEWAHMPPIEDTTAKDYSKTFTDVFNHYMEHRAFEKREATTRKHKSLWEHHIQGVFGDKKLAEVSKSEIYNYLLKLYHDGDEFNHFERGYAYGYVESFLKFFWMIYGYAYDNNWVEPDRYTKDFLNKTTKLTMPAKIEDDKEEQIEIYTQEELNKIEAVMKDGNLYISYLLCFHCGLRISECMGLMWSDFDKTNRRLYIRRQMLYSYDDKVFYLGPTKTKKSKRTVFVPDKLYDFLIDYKRQQDVNKQSKGYKNTEFVFDRNGKDKDDRIVGGDFIQRKENGELITINSVKYWTDKVKKETGINFHFHALRHTNASMLAARNIPIITLAEHLGHANTNVCQQYYVTSTQLAEDRLRNALNDL